MGCHHPAQGESPCKAQKVPEISCSGWLKARKVPEISCTEWLKAQKIPDICVTFSASSNPVPEISGMGLLEAQKSVGNILYEAQHWMAQGTETVGNSLHCMA